MKYRAVVSIEVDDEAGSLHVDTSGDPAIPEGGEAKWDELNLAGKFAAIGVAAMNQACEAQCFRCAADQVKKLAAAADVAHEIKAAESTEDGPTQH